MSDLLSRQDLLKKIEALSGVPRRQADDVLIALAVITGAALADDKTVRLPGIGDLKPKQVAARAGVCAFGEYSKPAERRVTLRPAQALRERIALIL
ncbi:MAG: HU family DNA-binding protein [Chromatiaceae bacterium]|nr:HU family DNA-binding protein [Chromatiaceae bacterium]MBP8024486.1 HU family DNA-binding protein [Chromatiaceae bacterium]